MNLELQDRVVLVTGGASGIGRGICEAFGQEGALIAFTWYSNESGAAETVATIQAGGGKAIAIHSDLAEPSEAKRVVDKVVAEFGRLDVVVANAGGLLQRSPIETCTLELWNRALAVNLTSTFLTCQAAIPALKETRGSIVTVSSLAAHDGGGAGSGHYAAAKGGVLTFTKALAKELGPTGVRVNSVAPGLIGTQFHDRFSSAEGRLATVGRTPLAREGTPADVASVVVFLASPRSSFLTGEVIEVNGGQGVF
ncbi:MAG: SDR family NAD(P)-dependent oxidoreductase [Thermomicrobiales bacterium]